MKALTFNTASLQMNSNHSLSSNTGASQTAMIVDCGIRHSNLGTPQSNRGSMHPSGFPVTENHFLSQDLPYRLTTSLSQTISSSLTTKTFGHDRQLLRPRLPLPIGGILLTARSFSAPRDQLTFRTVQMIPKKAILASFRRAP